MTILDQLLALNGQTRADLPTTGQIGRMVRAQGVAHDPELARVAALPRRAPAAEVEIEALSAFLRKRERNDGGAVNRLRPAQVEALRELFECRGLFAPMRVGSGKTLVTLLAATLLDSQRPVLMVPASLRGKTRREFAAYHQDWHVCLPRLVSYQEMGRPDREGLLVELAPDLLLLDEAHHARNLDAAVTRRIERVIDVLRPVVGVMSGTLITDKIMDYQHHAAWSLREGAPLPLQPSTAERWGQALDRDVGLLKRWGLGALAELPGGYHVHFRGSRGVVPTPGSDCDASISVSVWRPETPKVLRDAIEQTATTGARPDGEPLDEWDLPDCLCQLALGFYYRWDPEPPDWWLRPRRGWRVYARAVLDEHLPGFDSEGQLVNALDHGGAEPPAGDEGRELLASWRAVRDEFTPNPVPVWLDPSVLEQAIKHTGRGCLIWTRYRAVGAALESMGVPYYGAGTHPEEAQGRTIAVSVAAHSTGRNLQAWHLSLVLTPMANAGAWEQLIGRTHRAGQRADTVEVDVIGSIPYHGEVLGRVLTEARAITKASGFEHKLVTADWQ